MNWLKTVLDWIKTAYRTVVNHLTKVLGLVGAIFMTLFSLDPTMVQSASQMYLSDKWVHRIGIVLFALVIARGWWTGWKAQQK